MEDKFKLFKKWFWIGIIVGFLSLLGGVLYGIALIIEPEHRKEGMIIALWSILSFLLLFYLASNLQTGGFLPPQL